MHDDLARARAESAALLGLKPERLSPADALKCDLVSALRLVIDDELARATSGNGADLGKLIVAVEHLTGLMRDAKSAEPEDEDEGRLNHDWTNDPDDPRYKLKQYLDRSVEAAREDERDIAKTEIDQLKAMIADRDAELEDLRAARAKPVGPARPAAHPAESPPQAVSGAEAERRRLAVNADRSAYQQQGLRPAGGELWRGHTWRFE